MDNIYHKHTSSNSYWDNHWREEDYYLCESMEEYEQIMAAKKKETEDYKKSRNAEIYGAWRFDCSEEKDIHADEFYYAHEWQGKKFDAVGFTFVKHLERSDHYYHYLKPGSVGTITPCTDHGCGWMYAS